MKTLKKKKNKEKVKSPSFRLNPKENNPEIVPITHTVYYEKNGDSLIPLTSSRQLIEHDDVYEADSDLFNLIDEIQDEFEVMKLDLQSIIQNQDDEVDSVYSFTDYKDTRITSNSTITTVTTATTASTISSIKKSPSYEEIFENFINSFETCIDHEDDDDIELDEMKTLFRNNSPSSIFFDFGTLKNHTNHHSNNIFRSSTKQLYKEEIAPLLKSSDGLESKHQACRNENRISTDICRYSASSSHGVKSMINCDVNDISILETSNNNNNDHSSILRSSSNVQCTEEVTQIKKSSNGLESKHQGCRDGDRISTNLSHLTELSHGVKSAINCDVNDISSDTIPRQNISSLHASSIHDIKQFYNASRSLRQESPFIPPDGQIVIKSKNEQQRKPQTITLQVRAHRLKKKKRQKGIKKYIAKKKPSSYFEIYCGNREQLSSSSLTESDRAKNEFFSGWNLLHRSYPIMKDSNPCWELSHIDLQKYQYLFSDEMRIKISLFNIDKHGNNKLIGSSFTTLGYMLSDVPASQAFLTKNGRCTGSISLHATLNS